MVIAAVVISLILLGLLGCVALTLLAEDAAGVAGCIEEGQRW